MIGPNVCWTEPDGRRVNGVVIGDTPRGVHVQEVAVDRETGRIRSVDSPIVRVFGTRPTKTMITNPERVCVIDDGSAIVLMLGHWPD